MITFAHITDLHTPPKQKIPYKGLTLKQKISEFNWRARRHKIHSQKVIDILLSDLKKQIIDHFLITGDQTNIGTDKEYIWAADLIKTIAPADKISLIPGNHDLPVKKSLNYPQNYWMDFIKTDVQDQSLLPDDFDHKNPYPLIRQFDKLVVIGINSAIPTLPFQAHGAVDKKQLKALTHILKQTRDKGHFSLIMIHHPPLEGLTPSVRQLSNHETFKQILIDEGADMVIYGHNHRFQQTTLETKTGPCQIIGAPSFSVCVSGHYELAGYHIYLIDPTSKKIQLERRSIQLGDDGKIIRINVGKRAKQTN